MEYKHHSFAMVWFLTSIRRINLISLDYGVVLQLLM